MNQRFSRLLKIFTGTNSGAEEELLQLEGRLERFVHFWVLAWTHFVRNRCLVRASSLAYTTLLALIPLLAVVISIGSGLLKGDDEDKFYQAIASITPAVPAGTNSLSGTHSNSVVSVSANFTNLSGATLSAAEMATNEMTTNRVVAANDSLVGTQKEIARQLRSFVQNTNTQSGKLGATGMIVFVFIALMMLRRIEETFNDIWGVTQGRNWLRQIQLYSTIILFGPLLMFTALGLAGSAHLQTVKSFFHQMPVLENIIFGVLPLLVLWFAFAGIYLLIPNTKVKFSAAFIGGAVAGTLWHLNNTFSFLYVSRVVTNSKIYGSIGLIPLFMLSLYFSWAILLFGAQVAYAFQNRVAYLQDKLADNVNQRGREFVALRIMTLLGQRFQNGLKPATALQLADELGVPGRLTQQILRTLAAAQLVTEVSGGESAYVPARSLENINAHDVLNALRTASGRELPANNAPALAEIYGEFARIAAAERDAAEKISLLALTQRVPAQLANPQPEIVKTKPV